MQITKTTISADGVEIVMRDGSQAEQTNALITLLVRTEAVHDEQPLALAKLRALVTVRDAIISQIQLLKNDLMNSQTPLRLLQDESAWIRSNCDL